MVFCFIAFPALTMAEGAKIGFVNAIVLLDKAPQTKAAKEKVEREFKARDNQLVNAQKELRQQEEKLKRDGSTMSSADRQKLEQGGDDDRHQRALDVPGTQKQGNGKAAETY